MSPDFFIKKTTRHNENTTKIIDHNLGRILRNENDLFVHIYCFLFFGNKGMSTLVFAAYDNEFFFLKKKAAFFYSIVQGT